MAARCTAKCSRCEEVRSFGDSLFRLYDLKPEPLPLFERFCWCIACDDVTVAEWVPSIGEIVDEWRLWKEWRNRFRWTRRPRGREPEFPIGRCCPSLPTVSRMPGIGWDLAHYEKIVEWRLRRRSGSICLTCRRPEVIVTRGDSTPFLHFGCGGRFRALWSVDSGGGLGAAAEWYDAEGRLLHKYEPLAETRPCHPA